MSFYTDNSPFWRYFRDTLAFGLIAVPGALAAVIHGLARYLDDVRRDILWLRDQFVPTQADDTHIPLHGDSRAVPRTRFDTAARYRTRVEYAAKWHKMGGKEWGLPQIIAAYGFLNGEVYNKRKDNPALWAHFDLKLLQPPRDFDQEDVAAVLSIANQYKPGRSVIGTVQFANQESAPLCFGAAAQTRVVVNHYAKAWEPQPPQPAPLMLGAASHAYITFEHRVKS